MQFFNHPQKSLECRDVLAQLKERRLVIEWLLVQCLNRAFRRCVVGPILIGANRSTRRGGPVRLKTCKQNRKKWCPVLARHTVRRMRG